MNNFTPNNNQNQLKQQNQPVLLFQPYNMLVFSSFFSPIILVIIILSTSFIFQNFKGFIFLGFLLGISLVRNLVYLYNNAKPQVNDNTVCSSIQYTSYGNTTFSSFVFAFTIMYICLPMFINSDINYWVFSGLITYFIFDTFIKIYKKCIGKMSELFINVLLGLASSALIVSLMYSGGSSKYLFFNEISSNRDVCSMPRKQTFKCSVYKNGELVGSTNSN